MSQVDLEALERLLGKATPRPWKMWGMDAMAGESVNVDGCTRVARTFFTNAEGRPRTNDLSLICAAVNALPALLEEVRAGREALAVANVRAWERGRNAAVEHLRWIASLGETPEYIAAVLRKNANHIAALASPSVPTQEVAAPVGPRWGRSADTTVWHRWKPGKGGFLAICGETHTGYYPGEQPLIGSKVCDVCLAAPAGPPPAPPVLGAARDGTCKNFWHPGRGKTVHPRREAAGDPATPHEDFISDSGCLNWKAAPEKAALKELGRRPPISSRRASAGGCGRGAVQGLPGDGLHRAGQRIRGGELPL
jgi:hypothetical protein